MDIFIINLAVELFTSWSRYFWMLYLLIPGYFAFQAMKYLCSYLDKDYNKEEEGGDIDEKMKKKLAKQKKKDEQNEKVKYKNVK